jgi:hypothetical protein
MAVYCCLFCSSSLAPLAAEARCFLRGMSFDSLLRRDVLLVALAALSAEDWRLASETAEEFRFSSVLRSIWLCAGIFEGDKTRHQTADWERRRDLLPRG